MNDLLARLTARAAKRPDDIVLEGSDAKLTAAELADAVRAVAASLRHAGIDKLGLLADDSPAWVIADLACQREDICLIPLPQFFSDEQLRHIIRSGGIDALLTDDTDRLEPHGAADIRPMQLGEKYRLMLVRLTDSSRRPLPQGTRKITFTSGSTGAPRGVCLDLAQQLRVATALTRAIGLDAPRHLCLAPLSTLLENIGGVYVPLLADGTSIVPRGADIGRRGGGWSDIPRLLEALERHQPTSIIIPPQLLVALVAALEDGWYAPDSLRFVAVGGAKVSANLIRLSRSAGLPVYEGYGLSETASVACLNRPGADLPGSVGRPLEHAVVDIEGGEITVRGNTFLGYLDDESSWYPAFVRTGDVGYIDERGFVHVEGRRKNLLISSYGRNINPEWVESQLLSHPMLAECVAFGEARPCCVALLTPSDPACSDEDIQLWINHVNSTLPDYARVKLWHRLDDPLSATNGLVTANGRPQRAAIEQRYAEIIESMYDSPRMADAS